MARTQMTQVEKQIAALPDDVRDRVIERAAILLESGTPEDDVDGVAYEMETGRALPGLARARPRAVEETGNATEPGRPKSGTGD